MSARRQLIVDGYNVIHAWPELAAIIGEGRVEDARRALIAALADYASAAGERVTVVFDAHGRAAGARGGEAIDGVTVLFGSRVQSADHVIERHVADAARSGDAGDIIVATGDHLQRDMVMAMGAAVIGPIALLHEVRSVQAATGAQSDRRRREAGHAGRLEHSLDEATRARLERMRRGHVGGTGAPRDT